MGWSVRRTGSRPVRRRASGPEAWPGVVAVAIIAVVVTGIVTISDSLSTEDWLPTAGLLFVAALVALQHVVSSRQKASAVWERPERTHEVRADGATGRA